MITASIALPLTIEELQTRTLNAAGVEVGSIIITPATNAVAVSLNFKDAEGNVLSTKMVQFSSKANYDALFAANPKLAAQLRKIVIEMAIQGGAIPAGTYTDGIFGDLGHEAVVPPLENLMVS